ncbi:MAG TPA: acyl-CoA thioesterase, partial [Flavipsychrobacter sp.]|nr:acyl-CoA thioesterase [Flavipsychrobacter sp.]
YFDYFINAREDHLTKYYNFNIYQVAKEQGISWVVTKHEIAYFKPALLMEKVVIQSAIRKMGEKDILVEMMMWNKDKSILKSLLWTNFTHINLMTQKSEKHSDEFINKFKVFEIPLENISFEERVGQLKNKTAVN